MKNKFFFSLLFLFVIIFLIISPYYFFLTKTLKISPIKTLLSLNSLKTYNNQVTILILGIAGENHEGATLSDSIIVANYNLRTNKLLTISIPRDIWSRTLQDKINTAYAYGEAKQKGGGLKLAKAEIGAVVGIPIQYATVIDFAKFKELIDLLGGIDIDVDQTFKDNQFPITGRENDECNGDTEFKCRYETVSFKKGSNHMDGKTALKFIRSRHADGAEGNDFARNRRQQKILAAIKKKLIESAVKPNLKNWKKISNSLDDLITRDISNQQAAIILKNIVFSKDFSQKDILLAPDLFFVPQLSSQNDQYTLIPKEKNFSEIHRYIRLKQEGEKKK
ncbi:hypothetical protein A2767_04730 [Candidatus Roizmanbacteria bacterium RIFCSPHIGHO2_01_FULL_35_10]|uniref:Cell envelope-related transcriptional attenuator domain-containing protein n=1 Tax=Candidatus Roizmanbacteria bacterium RIFCSPLOWO2_01_FULL_35_13 TaxID=1802055 RepID=A0A1F7I6Z3_9BACT|nr:MAG: hypothetical protein A2767_04730 [Candidatus Roizmanbacteria bacterium RIFCSPHIGHO2_01_FULL_35_10]OGK39146.1 MAG: hypothetical protein A3A74_03565 [Candidatus Roizmanbacteria bacterium RIFCSPLOWO2_01_FULL_35_13]